MPELTPITYEEEIRDQKPAEFPMHNNEQVLEGKIRFNFWNGHIWIEHECHQKVILTRAVIDSIESYKKLIERNCWNYLSDKLQAGEISYQENEEIKTEKILAIARYPIIWTEDK